MLQGGAASLAVFLETAPPPLYLVYMLAAGFGLPVSIASYSVPMLCSSPQALSMMHVAQLARNLPTCLQCSEDALVVWAGSNIFRGVYGGPAGIAYVLGIIYFGVVVSDMVR